MESISLIANISLLIISFVIVVVLLRQLQSAKVKEATFNERLLAKEVELNSLQGRSIELNLENNSLKNEIQSCREELAAVKTSLELERKRFDEKVALLNESREQLGASFKNIANEIFDDKSRKFTEANKETLGAVLEPFQDKIKQFEKRVEETYDKESKERFSLTKEIENLQKLNVRMSEEAVNLTNALRGDNKAQGSWGEFVLESILEKSGLVKGREYEVQVALKDEGGDKARPDVVVYLPESREIVIDSKVSLKAWDAYCAAEEEQTKQQALKQHITSIRNHVKLLSDKDYQNLSNINSLDYVFLFMPIEAAYSVALQEESDLFQYAFERNIIFVVPTTLLTSLKTVHNLWRLAQQNQNAKEIAEKAGALYDKFVAFVDDLDEIGARIDTSKKSFEKAKSKLISGRGNLINRAELLKNLGAKTSKKQKSQTLTDALEEGSGGLSADQSELNHETKVEH
ncbi:MAG: DNA recombination protein RmuC [Gammaproteobacteria bacterium]|nr:DNA recombination protein RmuC [Gammaproteobacteria bacterium]